MGVVMGSTGETVRVMPAMAAEDEALKRNTDCVYFLASPLTCKKGSECEYRHSEGARFNPRDCWYWLNGNCLNPKCSFRHPPLDALFGMQMPSAGPTSSSLHSVATTQNPAVESPANNMSKQSFLCYYFQKGQCLKGERCPYVHGPQASGIDVAKQTAVTSKSLVKQPYCSKKDQRTIKDKHVQQNVSKDNCEELNIKLDDAKAEKPSKDAEIFFDNVHIVNKIRPESSLGDDFPSLQKNNGQSGYSVNKPWIHDVQLSNERYLNGRETDEILGDSSDFEVLVEDDVENSNFFHGKDDFRRIAARDERTMNFEDDYEYSFSDYECTEKFERRHDLVGIYDQDGQLHGTYGQEQSFTPDNSGVSSLNERRMMHKKVIKPDEMDGSDLRHRLLKQRRLYGSSAVCGRDGSVEYYYRDVQNTDERYRLTHSFRGQNKLPNRNSISTRLQGRIKFPRRDSPSESCRSLQAKEDRGRRYRGRLLAAKPIDYQGRNHERTNCSSDGRLPSAARSSKGKPSVRYDIDSSNFAGPKSLAELKRVKINDKCNGAIQPESNDTKPGKLERLELSEDSPLLECPKPHSILKRKREAQCGETPLFANEMENRQYGEAVSGVYAALTVQSSDAPAVKTKRNILQLNKSGVMGDEQEGQAPEEDQEMTILAEDGQLTYIGHSSAKDGMELDALEDEELESYGQGGGGSDYEGMKLKTKDKNKYEEDECDEDEDNFAQKVSAMFS